MFLRMVVALSFLVALPVSAMTDYYGRENGPGTFLSLPPGESSVVSASPSSGGVFHLLGYVAHPTSSWPDAVALGDVTGEGRPDVVMTTTFHADEENDYHLFVFPQNASGQLMTPSKYPYNQTGYRNGLVVADLDGNNALDVAVGGNSGIRPFFSQADGTLASSSLVGPDVESGVLAALSLTPSGYVDLVSASFQSLGSLNINDGSGVFTSSLWEVPVNGFYTMAVADLDNDGIEDFVGAAGAIQSSNIRLYRNTQNGTLEPIKALTNGCGWGASGMDVGDVNHDGFADVVVSGGGNRPSSCVQIFYGDAEGVMDTPVTLSSYDIPETLQVVDINRDGRDDIVVLHGGWLKVGVYLQLSDGQLGAEALYTIPYASHYGSQALAVGDFTGDGCPDVAIADSNEGLVTLQGASCEERIFTQGFE